TTRIWANLQDRRFDDALNDAVALGSRLPGEANDQSRQAARFLGVTFGYLELARPTAVDAQSRDAAKRKLLARLDTEHFKSFDAGRQAVVERLGELKSDEKAGEAEAVAIAEARERRGKSNLASNEKKLAEQDEIAQASNEQLQDAQREMVVIQRQLASLAN